MTDYVYTDDMQEISGMGGGYEQTCRNMVIAGVKWFDENPTADPKFHGFEGVYGLIVEDNADAKELTQCMLVASGGDCTGAMMQACVGHVIAAHRMGWPEYQNELRKADA